MRDEQTIYRGTKFAGAGPCPVRVEEPGAGRATPLRRRGDLRNHSPDGFQWGYGGSGPAQLALALLADATDDEHALAHYQDFKWAVVAKLPDQWELSAKAIREQVGWVPAEGVQ